MYIHNNNRKQFINFLIQRWRLITNFAALERVNIALIQFAKENKIPMPQTTTVLIPKPCRQIEIIKQQIIEILPEAHFIDYEYESQAPLDPDDFVEVFVADHEQCIGKLQDVIEKMKVT